MSALPPRPDRILGRNPVAPWGKRVGPPAAAALLALLGVLAVLAFDPVHRQVPLCPFHAVTGLHCPLCGGLRAVFELAHLRVGAALRDNVVVVAALPLAAVAWLCWVAGLRRGQPGRGHRAGPDLRVRRRRTRLVTAGVVVLAVGFTVVRNLPFATGLRP